MDTKDFIDSLRMVADFYEAHPELPVTNIDETFNVFLYDDKATIAAFIKAFGGCDKKFDGDDIKLTKTFGSLTIKVWMNRSAVCERRVVGTKKVTKKIPIQYETKEVEEEIVEWDCGSIIREVRPQIDNVNVIEHMPTGSLENT